MKAAGSNSSMSRVQAAFLRIEQHARAPCAEDPRDRRQLGPHRRDHPDDRHAVARIELR